jgi:hypothetical protein
MFYCSIAFPHQDEPLLTEVEFIIMTYLSNLKLNVLIAKKTFIHQPMENEANNSRFF